MTYRYYNCVGTKQHTCDRKVLCNDCHVKANADNLIALPQEGNKMVPAPQAQPKDVRNVLDNLAKAIEKGASTHTIQACLE